MRFLAIILFGLIWISTFYASDASSAKETNKGSVCGERCRKLRAEFRYIVSVGKEVYCYWPEEAAETKLDYDAFANEIENSITDSTDYTTYSRLIEKWAGAFHDGHVNFFHKSDPRDLIVYRTPLRFEIISPATKDEKVIVSQGMNQPVRIFRGDQVLAVNGIEISDFLTQEEKFISGSTSIQRRVRVVQQLLFAYGLVEGKKPLELTIDRDGRVLKIGLKRQRIDLGNLPEAPGPEKDLEMKVLPGNIGYLKIRTFTSPKMRERVAKAMDDLADTKGLLLDLRENIGGSQAPGDAILHRLNPRRMIRFHFSYRYTELANELTNSEVFGRPWTPGSPYTDLSYNVVDGYSEGQKNYENKPVVILIGPVCFSACDNFLNVIREYRSNDAPESKPVFKLVTLVGEPSGGGSGGNAPVPLEYSGASFRYSIRRTFTPLKMKLIEGPSTLPDIPIGRTRAEIKEGVDRQLEKAVEVLKSRLF